MPALDNESHIEDRCSNLQSKFNNCFQLLRVSSSYLLLSLPFLNFIHDSLYVKMKEMLRRETVKDIRAALEIFSRKNVYT